MCRLYLSTYLIFYLQIIVGNCRLFHQKSLTSLGFNFKISVYPMQKILLFTCFILIFGCTSQKNSTDSSAEGCDTFGAVQDFSDLDGCQLLIVLENGNRLSPAKINDTSFKLADGQKIKFGYKKLPDMASICMSESAIIEITCIEAVSYTHLTLPTIYSV